MGGVSGQGGHGGPATPTRGHGVVPGVVISPSSGNAQVRLHRAGVNKEFHLRISVPRVGSPNIGNSMLHLLVLWRQCLETLLHRGLDKSQVLSIG